MSEPDQIQCGQCHRSFNERQLNFKAHTVESCPFCGNVVRKSEHTKMRRHDAIIVEDVAAIDAWLDAYAATRGFSLTKDSKNDDKERRWSIPLGGKWECEFAYQQDKSNFVAVRVFARERGQQAFSVSNRLQIIAAQNGVQPYGTHWTDGVSGKSEYKWGVTQFLSTDTLCNEIVDPVLSRLSDALDDAWGQI